MNALVFNDDTKQELCEGLAALPTLLRRWNVREIFAVIDPAVESTPQVRALTDNDQWAWRIFNGVKSNPDIPQVRAAMDCLGAIKPDAWLAIGGGTTIDLMKLVAAAASRRDSLVDMCVGRTAASRDHGRFVAVPTTAGTGSEATQFAVVYVEGLKYSVEHPTLLPDAAVLDPMLTQSLPPSVTAHTGLDALCQAIESLWSVRSTEPSRAWASEALQLAWRTLPTLARQPDAAARREMLTAAHLAGRAINLSRTTAPHAMSYALTIGYGVPHGAAVAMNIATLLRYNAAVTDADCADQRGTGHVRAVIEQIQRILGCDSPDQAGEALTSLVAALDCPTRLSQVGVTSDAQIASLVEQINAQRLGNNPRRITPDNQRELWEQIR
jgi:alcohol dehydrogenase class IV